MVYLFIFLGLLLACIGLAIANGIIKSRIQKKEIEDYNKEE